MININDVLKIFPGSKVVAEPEISESDWLGIQEEAARWYWDKNDEMWIERSTPPKDSSHCLHCAKSRGRRVARGETAPKWRRYGKIIERSWPDGPIDLFCSSCGRRHVENNDE